MAQVTQTVGQNMTDISNIGIANTSKVRHIYTIFIPPTNLLCPLSAQPKSIESKLPILLPVHTKLQFIIFKCSWIGHLYYSRIHQSNTLPFVSKRSRSSLTFLFFFFPFFVQTPKIVTTHHPTNYANLTQSGGTIQMPPPRLKDRGTSLPPSALPRPPRSLKPPRKIDYDRLSDTDLKARSQTPPKLLTHSPFDIKSSSLKRNDFMRRDYSSPAKNNYVEMKEVLTNFPNPHFSLKRKDYGTMQSVPQQKTEFSKPEYTSTKYYQRLEESPKLCKPSADGFKRSLLPSARKYSPAPNVSAAAVAAAAIAGTGTTNKQQSRDSLNSSESNHSVVSNMRQSPVHLKIDTNSTTTNPYGHNHHTSSRTPPRYMSLTPQEKSYLSSRQPQMPPSPNSSSSKSNSLLGGNNSSVSPASLPPKPIDNRSGNQTNRRGGSITRGENRYRIQF